MALPISSNPNEQKHADWTAVGSDKTAQRTYASIQTALEPVARRHSVEIFLQGSYANHTNSRADSDVDVVAMTTRSFNGNGFQATMTPELRSAWESAEPATYRSIDLRADIVAALTTYYGADRVEEKNKCVKVHKRDGYLDADMVPCMQYRHYSPQSRALGKYTEGVAIHPLSGGLIVNFPKEHRKNGETKNKASMRRYKPTVRQVKRLRNEALRLGLLNDGDAPGYLLECMVFNVPNRLFGGNDSTRLHSVVDWLAQADLSGFHSADRIHTLFETDPGNFALQRGESIATALSATLNA